MNSGAWPSEGLYPERAAGVNEGYACEWFLGVSKPSMLVMLMSIIGDALTMVYGAEPLAQAISMISHLHADSFPLLCVTECFQIQPVLKYNFLLSDLVFFAYLYLFFKLTYICLAFGLFCKDHELIHR